MARLTGPNQFFPASDSLTRSTTALTTVGNRASNASGEFIYVRSAVGLAVSGEPVGVSGTLSAVVSGDLDTGAFLGISEAPFASGDYGYVRTKGSSTAIVESGAVAGDYLQLSSTVGKLKKITTSGTACAIALAASDNASAAAIAIHLIGT